MKDYLLKIESFLKEPVNGFAVERNKQFAESGADLYAFRKAGMAGADYIFIHDLCGRGDVQMDGIIGLHERARKYVNGFYRLPKVLRFSVPNIVSFFISDAGFPGDAVGYSEKKTRTMAGGEIHSVYLADLKLKRIHGQGMNTVTVDGIRFVFKKIDPQNRAYNLSIGIGGLLFGTVHACGADV